MATPLEAALEYANRGWPVLPLHYPLSKGKCSCGKPDCESPAKHPMTPHGLKDATKDHSQIKAWWGKTPKANVGIVTGSDSGLVVLDVDPRNGGTESLKSISKLGNLPVTPEVYTGGGGEHVFMAHPGNGTKVRNAHSLGGYFGIDLKGDGGYVVAPPSVHISGGRYTWKRHHLKNKLAAMPAWFRDLLKRPDAGRSLQTPQEFASIYKEDSSRGGVTDVTLKVLEGTRDNAIFNLVKSLRKGGMPYDEVCQYAVMFAKNCCAPPISEEVAIAKVNSTWAAERNIGAEIRHYIECYGGVISLQGVTNELCLVTERDKSLLRVTMSRLVKANVLRRIENKPGLFCKVEGDLETFVLTDDDDDQPLALKWPFGLENLVDIMPKNIVVVAGSKDAGKTAFCLNTVKLNQNNWDIHYFSSEMDVIELKRRLRRFDDMRISEWRFHPHPRASKFCDVIFPDALNIIDYLEISQDFNMVAQDIRDIYDKLGKGLCLIALQKDKDAEYGRGKSFSLEKARMYLTLDRTPMGNLLTIKSGKNWHQEGFNPVGRTIKYKIINGSKLLEYE